MVNLFTENSKEFKFIAKLVDNSKIRLFKNQKMFFFERDKLILYVMVIVATMNILVIVLLPAIKGLTLYEQYVTQEVILIINIIESLVSFLIVAGALKKNDNMVQREKNLITDTTCQMGETIDLLRLEKHDFMNHLQIILMQISNNKNEEARKYILGLVEDVKNIGIVFDTGSNYIDAILNFKNRKCMDLEIELTANIDNLLESTKLDEAQLSSIFLNIIDNAIEELKKCDKEFKYIHVDTYIKDNKHIISIKNNGRKIKDTERIFDMGVSSKGANRGYGLYSIKQLLLDNDSNIYVKSDDEETEFRIEISA